MKTNYLMTMCVQLESDAEAVAKAAAVAKASGAWVQVDFRDTGSYRRIITVGPKGEVLLNKKDKE